jgi:hypothetical protein
MTTTTTLNRVTQIGVESVNGTAVTATKKLQLIDIQTAANPEILKFPGTARRFAVAHALNKETSPLKLGGKMSYTELVYLLSNMYGAATITTPSNGVLTRKWVWNVPQSGSITRKTWTIEEGDSIAARRMAYGLIMGWGFSVERESDIALDGDGIAQVQTDGFSLTGALSAVAQIPMLGKHVNWYADNTWGGIGGTQLTKPMKAAFKYGSDVGVWWAMNRSNSSYADHADMNPDVDISLTYPNDATAASLMTDARANTTKYLRFEAQGDLIESVTPDYNYKLTLDVPCRITKLDSDGDEKGVRVRTFHFTPIEDSTAGYGMVATLYTTLTAL